ncbi:cupin domain-containing protein [Thalassococcus sp. BH17M4-6]|uniref:cupin domain-containing protein n=1 Tax=Thalassococcus sp. BH17M4-6 TaxID=3413148 RepID=UPI003BEB06D5
MSRNILGPDALEWQGVQYRTILSTDATGGAMSILDTVSPAGSGPPRHVHHDADETFVLLSGDWQFWLDGRTLHRGPGQTVFVPRGQEHSFRAVGHTPARHLTILTPGGFEGFFSEMASEGCRIPQDMPRICEVAARYQLEFTGPPMGGEPHTPGRRKET